MSEVESITSQFLFGQPSRPANIESDALIRGSVSSVFSIDRSVFMSSGAGRFALPGLFAVVQGFFQSNSASLENTTGTAVSYTKEQIDNIVGVDSNRLLQHQTDLSDGNTDYANRVYITNSIQYVLGDPIFVVEADGTRHIRNLSVRPDGNDNFDFSGGNVLATLGNPILSSIIDPEGIGRQVVLTFVGSAPTRADYTSTDFSYDQALATTWEQTPQAHLLPDILDLVSHIKSTYSIVQNGHPVVFGTSGDDVIDGQRFVNDLTYHQEATTGSAIFGGFGNDKITLSSITSVQTFKIDGGSGNDTVDASGSSIDLRVADDGNVRLTHVEGVVGGSGDDTFIWSTGLKSLDGGPGTDTLDLTHAPLAASVLAAGEGAQSSLGLSLGADALTLSNIEVLRGTVFGDSFTLGQDQAGYPLSGLSLIDGGDGEDALNLASFSHGITAKWDKGSDGKLAFTVDVNLAGTVFGESYPTVTNVESIELTPFNDTLSVSGGQADPQVILRGGNGTDTFLIDLTDGTSNVVLDGGNGNDSFIITKSGSEARRSDSAAVIQLSAGIDTIDTTGLPPSWDADDPNYLNTPGVRVNVTGLSGGTLVFPETLVTIGNGYQPFLQSAIGYIDVHNFSSSEISVTLENIVHGSDGDGYMEGYGTVVMKVGNETLDLGSVSYEIIRFADGDQWGVDGGRFIEQNDCGGQISFVTVETVAGPQTLLSFVSDWLATTYDLHPRPPFGGGGGGPPGPLG